MLACIGVGLLVLRAQRNTLTNRHVRALADADALRRMAPLLDRMRDQLAIECAAIAAELSHLRPPATTVAYPPYMGRALGRIAALGERLDRIDQPSGGFDRAEAPPGGGPGAELPSGRPGDAAPAKPSDRLLLAREATLGASILGVLTFVAAIFFEPRLTPSRRKA